MNTESIIRLNAFIILLVCLFSAGMLVDLLRPLITQPFSMLLDSHLGEQVELLGYSLVLLGLLALANWRLGSIQNSSSESNQKMNITTETVGPVTE